MCVRNNCLLILTDTFLHLNKICCCFSSSDSGDGGEGNREDGGTELQNMLRGGRDVERMPLNLGEGMGEEDAAEVTADIFNDQPTPSEGMSTAAANNAGGSNAG